MEQMTTIPGATTFRLPVKALALSARGLDNFEGFTIMFFKAENADQRKTFFLDNFTTWGWKNVYFISVDLQLTILV